MLQADDLVVPGGLGPLAPEVAQRTITMYGPTKAFKLAGFKVGFLGAENPALLARVRSEVEDARGAQVAFRACS